MMGSIRLGLLEQLKKAVKAKGEERSDELLINHILESWKRRLVSNVQCAVSKVKGGLMQHDFIANPYDLSSLCCAT